jgi:hypothetical protein
MCCFVILIAHNSTYMYLTLLKLRLCALLRCPQLSPLHLNFSIFTASFKLLLTIFKNFK